MGIAYFRPAGEANPLYRFNYVVCWGNVSVATLWPCSGHEHLYSVNALTRASSRYGTTTIMRCAISHKYLYDMNNQYLKSRLLFFPTDLHWGKCRPFLYTFECISARGILSLYLFALLLPVHAYYYARSQARRRGAPFLSDEISMINASPVSWWPLRGHHHTPLIQNSAQPPPSTTNFQPGCNLSSRYLLFCFISTVLSSAHISVHLPLIAIPMPLMVAFCTLSQARRRGATHLSDKTSWMTARSVSWWPRSGHYSPSTLLAAVVDG
ncbi:hypothetical protein K439DRAFT_1155157 [Ramaria rubella]|nr:hypothetical protein K439DRAFT_1155157 [Ramaria rubella]